MIKRCIIGLFLTLLCTACAVDPELQASLVNCTSRDFYFDRDGEVIVFVGLPEHKQRTYILRNRATYPVIVDRVLNADQLGGSAGWRSQIDPSKASALVLDKPLMRFSCSRAQGGDASSVNCRQVFAICETTVETPYPGSYWRAENQKKVL